MDDHVHVRHRPRGGNGLLTVHLEWRVPRFAANCIISSSTCSHAIRSPAEPQQGSIHAHAGSGAIISAMIGATSGGVKKLAGGLATAFRELADQVLVAAADDVMPRRRSALSASH
jgi:hypothetical protein